MHTLLRWPAVCSWCLLAGVVGCAPEGGDAAPLDGQPAEPQPGDAGPMDGRTNDAQAAAPDGAAPDLGAGPDAAPEAPPPAPGDRPVLGFPVHPDDRDDISSALMFGVDRDGRDNGRTACEAYDGDPFPACYGGHDGSDFVLRGGFRAMDAGSARVIAASGGEVILTDDGHYDRCHGDVQSQDVSCDGEPMVANKVYVRHANGWITHYLHLKRGSVAVREGDWVDCGAVLGLIGSSGYSTLPHLHLEVRDPQGRVVDPYAVDARDSLWGTPETATDVRPGNGCDPAWGPARE